MDSSSDSPDPTHLVAIGASAGGLEAIEKLFNSAPKDTGMAFVIVQHLSPDFKSLMDEILVRFTDMEVKRVEEGMRLAPNTAYLIPAGKQMEVTKEGFHLTERRGSLSPELTISIFFESVAKVWKEKSVGIILSGSGSDGSRGLAAISEAGGLAMVQDPDEAAFDSMPNAALKTGRVDIVRSAADFMEAIKLFRKDPEEARNLDVNLAKEEVVDDLERIYQLLNQNYGIDFTDYKPTTVDRRIERRTTIHHKMSLPQYRRFVEDNSEELNQLYKDLLIGVTHFFRDTAAFEGIENKVIPDLFDSIEAGEELRVWTAACATGEEVYSIAILLDEYQKSHAKGKSWKIFATDVHRRSLDTASHAEYTKESVFAVSTERLNRFFERKGDKYRVKRSLREKVVFAPHNILRDPPFTKINLVSCRNLLIYFSNEAKERVIGSLAFSLKRGGCLFLGSSETLGTHKDDFEPIIAEEKLFRKIRSSAYTAAPMSAVRPRGPKASLPSHDEKEPTFETLEQLLTSHLESGVLLDEKNGMLYSIGGTRRYLQPPSGRMTNKFTDMLPENLQLTITGAIQQARRRGSKVQYTVQFDPGYDEGAHNVRVSIYPNIGATAGRNYVFITLEKYSSNETEKSDEQLHVHKEDEYSASRIRELEDELQLSQEGMQNVVEELETSNEELQATNEELVASNEELQSTNEELQSVNEELYTVNAEFDKKNRELGELNGDLDNLLKSTGIGVVFLDQNLNIRKFTPAAATAIHLLASDIHRPLSHITNNLRLESNELSDLAESILINEVEIAREVQTKSGDWFLMKMLPFRNSTGSQNGVVIAFVDINQVKKAQQDRELEVQRQLVIMESVDSLVWIHLDPDGNCVEPQPAWERFLGQSWPDYRNFSWTKKFHDSDRERVEKEIRENIKTTTKFEISSFRAYYAPSNSFRPCEFSFWPVVAHGEHRGWVACLSDIHESEDALAEIAHQKAILNSIISNSDAAIAVKDTNKRYLLMNQVMADLVGLDDPSNALGKTAEDVFENDVERCIDNYDDEVIKTGRARTFEGALDPNNSETPFSITKFPLRAPEGTIEGVVGIATDMSDRKRQDQLRQQTDELSRVNRELGLRNRELDDYAHIISHDLKQPLRTLFGLTEMLNEEIRDQAEGDAAHYLDRISKASQKLREMIDAILEYSRSGRDEVDPRDCQVEAILSDVQDSLASDIESAGARFEISEDLPVVHADPTMLLQIFQNLIGNAIKFSDSNDAKVWIRAEKDETRHTFWIDDNGIGIDAEFRETIFKPFERLHTAEEYPGTGIGLAIAARLVHRHGGEIVAEDREAGDGASFRFSIPFELSK